MPTVSEILKADPCRQCPPTKCSFSFRSRLSLTRELQLGGCAHHYMKSAFPNLASYVSSLNLPKGNLLAEAPKGWESFTGTAFDRRLRYEYEPHYTDSVLITGTAKLRELSNIRIDEELESEDLDQRSIYAAVADIQFRSGQGERAWNTLEEGGDELKGKLIGDIQALMKIAWEKLDLSSPKFGPSFGISSHWIGGADADIIDAGCLIDVKCVKNITPTAFIRQTIAYALLDVENEHDLDSVGIYLARQGILWKIPLEDVAKHSNMTLNELRAQTPWGNPQDMENFKALLIGQHALGNQPPRPKEQSAFC